MDKDITLKNYLVIGLVFVLVMIIIAIPFYINISKNNRTTIEGVVEKVSDNYIVVISKDTKEYRLKTKAKYNVGDRLSINIKHVDRTKKPITGIIESVINLNDDDNSNLDEEIISYLDNLNNGLDNFNESNSTSIKEGFVDMIDFIFYGKELKGVTFKELSDGVKIKILKKSYIIDSKVDGKIPGYKEEISRTGSRIYSDVKTRILISYLDLTNKVCSSENDVCNSAREGLRELKSNFSLTWDTIKSLAGLGTSKLKSWYEIWKTIE